MKTVKRIMTATLLAIAAISTSSCYIRISKDAKEQLKERIRFREEMSEVVYDKSDPRIIHPGEFSGIENNSWLDLNIVQREGEPEVVINGTYRTRDSALVENIDGILNVSFANHVGFMINYSDIDLVIYTPNLTTLKNRGSGDIDVEGIFKSDSLTIENRGSGDIEASVQAESISITNIGSGDIDLNVNTSGSILLSSSGSGDIDIKGEVSDAVITKSGSGDIEAGKLQAERITVSKSGSGDVVYRKDGKLIEE